ncbi:MAG: radical SAM family heme chaperone HemW [Pirellulaceae bacterium]|nr:radical SAM family heme chaperone HemW [Pirellulaceae bacterium]
MPRSAYIHIPFCKHRCGYCNFTLVAGRDDLAFDFLRALELEMDRTLADKSVELDSLFLGGGTPSHLSVPNLARLLEILKSRFLLAANAEFSCEVNPLDCTAEKLDLLKSAGVNRLSVGGQSFQPRKLHRLQRDHSGQQLRDALQRTMQEFSNVSLDLIFAVPGETIAEWRADLDQAITIAPQHISTYGLTVERGSAFYAQVRRGRISEVEEDLRLIMYESAIERLTKSGIKQYEVSSFAQPGYECRHNLAYWQGDPWWAFGPGAASFIDSVRAVNHRSTTTYIRRVLAGCSPVAETEKLTPEQVLRERLVFGLRRLVGVDLAELSRKWGAHCESLFQPKLNQYVERGWLIREGDCIRLSRKGLVISDSLWPALLEPSP